MKTNSKAKKKNENNCETLLQSPQNALYKS